MKTKSPFFQLASVGALIALLLTAGVVEQSIVRETTFTPPGTGTIPLANGDALKALSRGLSSLQQFYYFLAGANQPVEA